MRSNCQFVYWRVKLTNSVSRAHGSPWFHARIHCMNLWLSRTRGVMKCIQDEHLDCMIDGAHIRYFQILCVELIMIDKFSVSQYASPMGSWEMQHICTIVSMVQKTRVHKLIMYAWECTDFTEGRWVWPVSKDHDKSIVFGSCKLRCLQRTSHRGLQRHLNRVKLCCSHEVDLVCAMAASLCDIADLAMSITEWDGRLFCFC